MVEPSGEALLLADGSATTALISCRRLAASAGEPALSRSGMPGCAIVRGSPAVSACTRPTWLVGHRGEILLVTVDTSRCAADNCEMRALSCLSFICLAACSQRQSAEPRGHEPCEGATTTAPASVPVKATCSYILNNTVSYQSSGALTGHSVALTATLPMSGDSVTTVAATMGKKRTKVGERTPMRFLVKLSCFAFVETGSTKAEPANNSAECSIVTVDLLALEKGQGFEESTTLESEPHYVVRTVTRALDLVEIVNEDGGTIRMSGMKPFRGQDPNDRNPLMDTSGVHLTWEWIDSFEEFGSSRVALSGVCPPA